MNKFKVWLFKLLFGFDSREIVDLTGKLKEIEMQWVDLLKLTVEIRDLAIDTAKSSGGPGWTDLVQNAIMHIDERIEDINGVLENHHNVIMGLCSEKEEVKTTNFKPTNKDNLN